MTSSAARPWRGTCVAEGRSVIPDPRMRRLRPNRNNPPIDQRVGRSHALVRLACGGLQRRRVENITVSDTVVPARRPGGFRCGKSMKPNDRKNASQMKRGSSGLAAVAELARAYPGRTVAALVLLCFAGAAESMSVVSLVPVLAIASNQGQAHAGSVEFMVANAFNALSLPTDIGSMLLLVVGGVFLKAALTLLAMRHVGYTVAAISTKLRLDLIRATLSANWLHFTRQPLGMLGNGISSESVRSGSLYLSGVRMTAEAIQAAFYGGLAMMISWQITAAGVAFGLITFVGLRWLYVGVRRAGQGQTDLLKSLNARMTDGLVSFKPLKAMAREDRLAPMLEHEALELNEMQRKEVLSITALASAHEPLLALFIGLGIYVAITSTTLPFSQLIVMAIMLQRIVSRIAIVQKSYQQLGKHESAYTSLTDTIAAANAAREVDAGIRAPVLKTDIVLKDVTYSYGDEAVLRNADLTVAVGKITALTGPSGSGKTTIADLIVGLIKPDRGRVLIDGVPLGEVDQQAWRRRIGYVPQDTFLFHDSIFANVSLGDPAILPEQVEWALKHAEAWEFVGRFPGGMNYVVGERGIAISGGQRQRIAIARAIVRQPALLILDEATTALDPATERAICATVRRLAREITVLAISHQSAIGEIADVVYELRQGGVQEPHVRRPVAMLGGE